MAFKQGEFGRIDLKSAKDICGWIRKKSELFNGGRLVFLRKPKYENAYGYLHFLMLPMGDPSEHCDKSRRATLMSMDRSNSSVTA